ncbi:MAG: GAF domain-containing protein, partial [Litorimonas sp.]
DNVTARLVTTICLLHHAFDYFFWTGVYLVDPNKKDELVIGPYQGTLGCLRIPFGTGNVRGVCGAAATSGETIIVDDVHAFPNHIACDSRSESEIVVPMFSPDGSLFGVLDVDSTELGSFCEIDQANLELLMSHIVI